MLLDVTAVLTSAAVDAVAEAFSAPELAPRTVAVAAATITPQQRAFTAAMDAATGGTSADAAGSGTDPSNAVKVSAVKVSAAKLPTLRGMSLLQQLGLLDRSQLTSFAAHHADVLTTLTSQAPAAAAVSSWWSGIPSARQADLAAAAPSVVGNLEGVPYPVRDRANRAALAQAETAIRTQLKSGAGRAADDQLTRRLHMLQQVGASLSAASATAPRTLVGLDPSGTGTAVVVVGDVTTADYVDYLIPGMYSSVDSQLTTWTSGGARIAADEQHWLDTLRQPGAARQTVAVVVWFGYTTPDVSDAASLAPARTAASALTASIDGLRATRAAHPPYVSITAHSYGSTAAMVALQNGLTVDSLAVVGSPGSPAATASALGVTGANVWVGSAPWDPIPQTGIFGSQPSSTSYGAHAFGVDGTVDQVTGRRLSAATTHTDYFDAGSESLRNLELIAIGRGDLVLAPSGALALG